ncbi:HAD family phosphatase [Pontibacter sp. G13]|uniref:HAD family hydrolase n=1 Tax=Pontibacter sp. G13 TaxID=3074898 RepID=UPI00288B593B|nr:HAD family phosphatase [Pontibacter sp. G13]WNJ16350.1 HAD family phosphatase [Pontibacter sp. G13]
MNQPYRNIVFDLGGVLIHWAPELLYRKIFDDPTEMRWFLEEIVPYSWNVLQDAGRSLAEATEERVRLFPEWEPQIRAYYGRWSEMLGGANEETVKLLKELVDAPHLDVFALTNWSAETFPIAQEQFGFLGWFKDTVVSGEVNMKKPDPKIYQLMLNQFKIDPNETVFLDDSMPNVKGAEAVGIKALHFESAEKLATDLRELGISW